MNDDSMNDLMNDFLRGDAVCIDESWFRVSCSVGRGGLHQQSQRSTAPLSVSSETELSDKNDGNYFKQFNETVKKIDLVINEYDDDMIIMLNGDR